MREVNFTYYMTDIGLQGIEAQGPRHGGFAGIEHHCVAAPQQ